MRDSRYLDLAEKTLTFLIEKMDAGRSSVSYSHDDEALAANIQGMLALYRATGRRDILTHALNTADILCSIEGSKDSNTLSKKTVFSEATPFKSTVLFDLAGIIFNDEGSGERFNKIYSAAQSTLIKSLINTDFFVGKVRVQ